MELTWPALADTQHAFDAVARTYDEENAANPLICAMRARTLALVTAHLRPGSSLLDLGCGPGCDAEALARMGYRVTAIDWSPGMAAQAHDRMASRGLLSQVHVRQLGIHELDRLGSHDGDRFDGAYSNLGPFNCVPDLGAAARALARHVRPGGVLVASVIGRLCPWEMARYGLSGRWGRVAVRFSRQFVPVPLEGRTVWTRYYFPREFSRAFADAGFRTTSLQALGLVLPPPYLRGFHGRHPGVMRWLDRVEQRVSSWPGLRHCGDHFLVAMTRS